MVAPTPTAPSRVSKLDVTIPLACSKIRISAWGGGGRSAGDPGGKGVASGGGGVAKQPLDAGGGLDQGWSPCVGCRVGVGREIAGDGVGIDNGLAKYVETPKGQRKYLPYLQVHMFGIRS